MLKIIHLIEHLHMGGEETLLVSLIDSLRDHLPEASEQILIVLKGGGGLLQKAEDKGIQVVDLGGSPKYSIPFRLRACFAEIRPDIVHTRLSSAGYWGRLAAMLVSERPRLFHGHGGNTFQDGGAKRKILEKILEPITFRHICVSESVKEHLVSHGFQSRKMEVIPNGISTSIPVRDGRVPAGSVKFISVGRLEIIKGHDILIQAVDLLREMVGTDFSVDIVGNGSERENLEMMIADLGLEENVRLLGQVDDICCRLSEYDGFVLPSRSEGLSLSLLEGLSAGIPVIATDVGETAKVLAGYGAVIPPLNPLAMAEAMADFIRSPSSLIATAAETPAIIRTQYGIDNTARRYAELFTGK